MAATQAVKFSHYMSVNRLAPTSSNFGGPVRCIGVRIENFREITVLTSGTLSASSLVGTFIIFNAAEPITVTLPAAVDIIAAFVASGTPLVVGSTFTVPTVNISTVDDSVHLASNTGIDAMVSLPVDIQNGRDTLLFFTVTSVTPGSETIIFSTMRTI